MGVLSMITRAIVRLSRTTTGAQTIQADDAEGYPTDDDVELYEQPGVTFRTADGAEVLLLELGADGSNLTALATSGRGKRPTTALEEGEGGLYYAGEFKVFLASDGKVYLGSATATDYVALASKVDTEIDRLWTALGTHVHAGVTTGPGSSGTATVVNTSESTAATKTLAE